MFTSSPEVGTLCLLLTSFADPLDSVSLVGVLRGPIFGVSDQELYSYRQAGGRFELTQPVVEIDGEGQGERASAALRALQSLYRLTRTPPAGAALEMILDETGPLPLAATGPGGAAAGNLLQAVDMVRQVTESGGSLAEAADAIREDAELSTEIESLPLEPGRQDVVRVMNLHRVKGLEAAVVFLTDPARGKGFPPEVRIVREGGRSRGYMSIQREMENWSNRPTIAEPADWSTHKEIEQNFLNAELNPLLYVARPAARSVGGYRTEKTASNKHLGAFEPYHVRVNELELIPIAARS
jgi:ATP-dependent helicase/nuclease subunit A